MMQAYTLCSMVTTTPTTAIYQSQTLEMAMLYSVSLTTLTVAGSPDEPENGSTPMEALLE